MKDVSDVQDKAGKIFGLMVGVGLLLCFIGIGSGAKAFGMTTVLWNDHAVYLMDVMFMLTQLLGL